MKRKVTQIYFNYGAIALITIFAAVQFILILRHKSPYLSDSYFYQHIYFELKGEHGADSREAVIYIPLGKPLNDAVVPFVKEHELKLLLK